MAFPTSPVPPVTSTTAAIVVVDLEKMAEVPEKNSAGEFGYVPTPSLQELLLNL